MPLEKLYFLGPWSWKSGFNSHEIATGWAFSLVKILSPEGVLLNCIFEKTTFEPVWTIWHGVVKKEYNIIGI